jgi:hypothetical protein
MALYRSKSTPTSPSPKASLSKAMESISGASSISQEPKKKPSARKHGAETRKPALSVSLLDQKVFPAVSLLDQPEESEPETGIDMRQVSYLDQNDAETEFRPLLDQSGLSISEFCSLTGTPLSTGKNWSRGATQAPRVAIAWLKMYLLVCSLGAREEAIQLLSGEAPCDTL